MKVNELRIGDWVLYNDLYCKIIGIDKIRMDEDRVLVEYHNGETDYCYIGYIEPIELTEEVLVKIGFKEKIGYINYSKVFYDENNHCDSTNIYYCSRLKHFKFTHDKSKEVDLQMMDLYNIKYLHQLQNAYYCITNQEMEIKL